MQYPFSPWNSEGHIYNIHSIPRTPKEAHKATIQ